MSLRMRQRGMTLIEVMIAVTIAAIIVVGLNGFVTLGLDAKAAARQGNELVYQGNFALERMMATARAAPPVALSTPTPGSTGNWFTTTMYCRDGANRILETTPGDVTCTSSSAIVFRPAALRADR
jgi:prepilin-type N-terminal cleavage/methylation domain-containing protein